MELTEKEIKFLTIMNETRIDEGKMFGRYFEEVKQQFTFSTPELAAAVKKLEKLGLITKIGTGGNEFAYFHTDKVAKIKLDKNLSEIRH
jgi:DNA-binding Lrp family transcriptional regulator